MSVMTSQAPPQQAQKPATNAPVLAPWPFPVGVIGTENVSDYDQTVTMSAATVKFPSVKIEPSGWLRGVWFDVTGTVSGNTATVTFASDTSTTGATGSPFSSINNVLFRDTGGEQIFGPFNGYDWMTTNKFGSYHSVGDPRNDINYSTTTGSASASGSFHFTLYLPLEIATADALGSVENRSENSVYRVELTLDTSTVMYTQAPSSLPTVEVKTLQDSYTEPVTAMSLSGRPVSSAPPSPGTIQYWKQESGTPNAGTQSVLITNGIGNGYRNILFKLIRNSGTRANGQTDMPDPLEVTLGTTRTRNYIKKTWMDKVGRDLGFITTSTDAALGWENGVFPLIFCKDVGLAPGNEARRRYQRTKTGNTYKVRGSFGNAGTLYVTSNYVVPRGNDFSQIVA